MVVASDSSSVGANCLAPFSCGLVMSQIQGPPSPSSGAGLGADVTKLALLGVWWTAWCMCMAQMVREGRGCQHGRWQRRILSSSATCGLWCAVVTGGFSSFHQILSPIVFFPYCSSLRHSLNSLINFSLTWSFLVHTLACSLVPSLCLPLSCSLSFLYLFQFTSVLTVVYLSLDLCALWLFPVTFSSDSNWKSFLIPPFVPPLSSLCVVSLSPSFPHFFPPSLPLFFVSYCVSFPFVCSDRPLPLIDSDGRLNPTP